MAKDAQTSVFRQKSMDRIASPEQLNDDIRVSNPSVWVVLGHLDTTLTAVAIADGGQVTLYVKEADISNAEAGMTVRVGDAEYTVSSITSCNKKSTLKGCFSCWCGQQDSICIFTPQR